MFGKSILWQKAFAPSGNEHSFTFALLIEDSPEMVAPFESLGGCAYRYQEEDAFRTWLAETGRVEPTVQGRVEGHLLWSSLWTRHGANQCDGAN